MAARHTLLRTPRPGLRLSTHLGRIVAATEAAARSEDTNSMAAAASGVASRAHNGTPRAAMVELAPPRTRIRLTPLLISPPAAMSKPHRKRETPP